MPANFRLALGLCSLGGALLFTGCDSNPSGAGNTSASEAPQPNYSLNLGQTSARNGSTAEAQSNGSQTVSQAQGEALILSLAAAVEKKYPPENNSKLIELYFFQGTPGKYSLLKGTDIFLRKEDGGPAVLEFKENSLAQGANFAGTEDPLSALANFPAHPKYRAKLAELLDSPNAAVRVGALLTLGRMPHPTLIPLLARSLKDDNLDVRCAAVMAFGVEERHILGTFLLERPENLAEAERLLALGQPLAVSHPYRNQEVHSVLSQYLAGPIRIGDFPVIIKTAVNLRMKDLISLTEQVHAQEPTVEAFLQQCYNELSALR